MKTLSKIAIVALSIVGVGFGAAYAYGPGGSYGPGAGMHGPGGFYGPGAGMHGPRGDMEAWQTSRLTSLKEALKITEAQEPAWTAFETTVRGQSAAMIAAREAMQSTRGNPEAHVALMQSRLEGMKTVLKARGELYEQLTAEQKAVFDDSGNCGNGGFAVHGGWRS